MPDKKWVLFLSVLLLINAAIAQQPVNQVQAEARGGKQEDLFKSDTAQTKPVEVVGSFYFIGDLGHSQQDSPPAALTALFYLLDSADEGRKEHSTLVFLGDNFSEAEQLPWKE